MTAELRELRPEDADGLRGFFTDVPSEDRTFFKEDISDATRAAGRWIAERGSVRRVAFDGDGAVVAFATLSPGVERTSHVADLRLVVAPQARGRGLGRALARQMLLEAVEHGFRKVTIDIASENAGAIRMFRELGFQPEALLRDQLCDPDGGLHDIVVLAHAVDEQWSGMVTGGIDGALS
jgi:ribosomal protein S18 acetylase RimI-like enzyme